MMKSKIQDCQKTFGREIHMSLTIFSQDPYQNCSDYQFCNMGGDMYNYLFLKCQKDSIEEQGRQSCFTF